MYGQEIVCMLVLGWKDRVVYVVKIFLDKSKEVKKF